MENGRHPVPPERFPSRARAWLCRHPARARARPALRENEIPYERTGAGAHELYRDEGIEIWCGDYFALPAATFDGVTALEMLLITLEHGQGSGPPFSVLESEVRGHYAVAFPRIETLYREGDLSFADHPRLSDATVAEAAYRLSRP